MRSDAPRPVVPESPNQALQQTAGHDSFLGLHAHRCPAAAELCRWAAETKTDSRSNVCRVFEAGTTMKKGSDLYFITWWKSDSADERSSFGLSISGRSWALTSCRMRSPRGTAMSGVTTDGWTTTQSHSW